VRVKRSGVYLIRHKEKVYVGSSSDLDTRLRRHLTDLRNGSHRNRHLQSAYDLYGEIEFQFTPILICSVDDLFFYEQRAIDVFNAAHRDYGYNQRPDARTGRGFPASEKQKSVASAMMRDPVLSRTQRAAARCRGHTRENIEMLRKWRADPMFEIRRKAGFIKAVKGVPCTASSKQKQSDTKQRLRAAGNITNNKDRKLTPDQVRQIRSLSGESLCSIGRKYSIHAKTVSHILQRRSYAWVV
jgi:group I intron endonuclease